MPLFPQPEAPVRDVATTRPRVVVLGSGWASMSFIKALPESVRYSCCALQSSSDRATLMICPRATSMFTTLSLSRS